VSFAGGLEVLAGGDIYIKKMVQKGENEVMKIYLQVETMLGCDGWSYIVVV
jgi:hypothetical protein